MVEKGKKNYASSKKLLTSIKEKGPLGKKSPFTRKEAVSEDQEVCGQSSQQTSPDRFEGEGNGLKKLMSIVHRMSMELESKFLDSL